MVMGRVHREKWRFVDGEQIGVLIYYIYIYIHRLDRFGLDPAETLFIDDREANIEAAAALGIHGFLFDHRDPASACEALRSRLL